MSNLAWLWGWGRSIRWGLALGLVLIALKTLFGLSMTGVQQIIIDDIFIGHKYDWIWPALLVFLGSMLLFNLFHILGSMTLNIYSRRLNTSLLAHYMNTLQGVPTKYYQNERLGRLTNYYSQEIGAITGIFGGLSSDAMQKGLSFIILTVIVGYASWPILVGVLLVGFVFVPLGRYFAPRIRALSKVIQEKRAGLSVHMVEGISSTKEVLAFNRQGWERGKLNRLIDGVFRTSLDEVKLQNKQLLYSEALRLGSLFLVLAYGGYAVMMGSLSIGMFVIVYQFSNQLMTSVNGLYETVMKVPNVWASVDRLRAVLEQPQDQAGHLPLAEGIQTMEWTNVVFQYGKEGRPILNGVSFSAKRGEKIAFVGSSGAGKSTIAQLLVRFYRPDHETITVNGLNVAYIRKEDWSHATSIVFQEAYLYPESIRANLTLGRDHVSENSIEHVCRQACIHEEIMRLPDGYDTVLGERGITLSGGQRQRLAIARALLAEPEFLILDEATSALDLETERMVMHHLDQKRSERLTIVIAHRLSTIKNADRIYVMDEGRIAEYGSHEELLARNQTYSKLLRMQE